MTVTEAARAMNLSSATMVYRLLWDGELTATRVPKAGAPGWRWDIDEDSVHRRIGRIAAKRSSRINRLEEAERRRAAGRARYAKVTT